MLCYEDVEEILMFCEKTENPVEKEKFLDKLVERVSKMINDCIKTINEFFQNHFTGNKKKELEDRIKNDPSFKDKKFKVVDYEKMEYFQETVCTEIEKAKTKEEVEEKMKKYRKQRNILLLVSAAITVGGVYLYNRMSKNKDAKIKKLKERNEKFGNYIHKCQDHINKLEEKNSDLSMKNKELAEKLKARTPAKRTAVAIKYKAAGASKSISNNKDLVTKKTSAIAEVIGDTVTDAKNELKEVSAALISPDKSTVSKVATVTKAPAKLVSSVVNGAKDSRSAATTAEKIIDKQEKLAKDLNGYRKYLKTKQGILKEMKDSGKANTPEFKQLYASYTKRKSEYYTLLNQAKK